MLLVALQGVGEVPQRGVHGPHVPQLPSLGELALALPGQQHALLVAGQGVGVVPYGGVHVAQAAEGPGRSLGTGGRGRGDVWRSVQSLWWIGTTHKPTAMYTHTTQCAQTHTHTHTHV